MSELAIKQQAQARIFQASTTHVEGVNQGNAKVVHDEKGKEEHKPASVAQPASQVAPALLCSPLGSMIRLLKMGEPARVVQVVGQMNDISVFGHHIQDGTCREVIHGDAPVHGLREEGSCSVGSYCPHAAHRGKLLAGTKVRLKYGQRRLLSHFPQQPQIALLLREGAQQFVPLEKQALAGEYELEKVCRFKQKRQPRHNTTPTTHLIRPRLWNGFLERQTVRSFEHGHHVYPCRVLEDPRGILHHLESQKIA